MSDAAGLRSPQAAARRHLRRAGPVIVLVAVLLAGVALLARPRSELPLDPASTAGDGTAALVAVLREVGARVEVTDRLPARPGTVLVLADDADEAAAEALRGAAEAGATVVVADPRSQLAPEPAGVTDLGVVAASLPRVCDLPALAGAERVLAPGSTTFTPPAGATGCYRRDAGSWLVAEPVGNGTLVVVGGPGFLVNALLGRADNAVLAVALLAPRPGTDVTILRPGSALPGQGDLVLADLVPRRVRAALLQLALAFGVVVAWRARRLGKPVTEPAAVRLPGSELVVAVGRLLQRAGGRDRAGQLLRDDLRRALCGWLGLPETTEPSVVAAAAGRRGVPAGELLDVLHPGRLASHAELVALGQRVETVRARVAGTLAAVPAGAPSPREGPDAADPPVPAVGGSQGAVGVR